MSQQGCGAGAPQRVFFTCTNAARYCAIHWTGSGARFRHGYKQGVVKTNPQNHLTSFLVVRCGQDAMAAVLSTDPFNPTFACEPHLHQGFQVHSQSLHMLCPGVAVDDNVVQVGISLCGFWCNTLSTRHWKVILAPNNGSCDKLVQTIERQLGFFCFVFFLFCVFCFFFFDPAGKGIC